MKKNWNEPLCAKIIVNELLSSIKVNANSFEDDCHGIVLR